MSDLCYQLDHGGVPNDVGMCDSTRPNWMLHIEIRAHFVNAREQIAEDVKPGMIE